MLIKYLSFRKDRIRQGKKPLIKNSKDEDH